MGRLNKIGIWGKDKFEGKPYIIAETTSTENFYIAVKGANTKKDAIRKANDLAKIYDEEYVVIQMK